MKFDFPNVFCGNKLESSCLPGRKPNPPVKVRSFLGDNKHLCVCVPDKLRFLLMSHPSGQRADFIHLAGSGQRPPRICAHNSTALSRTRVSRAMDGPGIFGKHGDWAFFTISLSLILSLNAPLFFWITEVCLSCMCEAIHMKGSKLRGPHLGSRADGCSLQGFFWQFHVLLHERRLQHQCWYGLMSILLALVDKIVLNALR